MCIEWSNLLVETLHPHEVPPGLWVKIGMDFSFKTIMVKIFNYCRLLQQVPIHLPSGICTIISRSSTISRELFTAEGTPTIVMSDNGPPFNSKEMNSKDLLESSTSCAHHTITSFLPVQWFHWGHGEEGQEYLQENWLISKHSSKSTTPSYGTPLSLQIFLLQLKYFMDDHHNEQSFQDPQSWLTYIRFVRDSLKYRTHRRDSSTEHTEQRIYECLKWINKYSSFPTNKGQVPWHGWQELYLKSWNVAAHTWSKAPTAESTRKTELT